MCTNNPTIQLCHLLPIDEQSAVVAACHDVTVMHCQQPLINTNSRDWLRQTRHLQRLLLFPQIHGPHGLSRTCRFAIGMRHNAPRSHPEHVHSLVFHGTLNLISI